MASRTEEQFIRDLLERVSERAENHVRPKIPSQTLQRALTTNFDRVANVWLARVGVPHYWAVYLHDGRGPVVKKGKGFLVFFKDPSRDPRLRGGRPVRQADARRLTRNQFRDGLAMNRAHLAAGGDPFDAPMIVVKSVGPAKATEFFTKGMAAFLPTIAAPIFRNEFDRYVQEMIDRDDLHDKDSAVFRLF